MALRVEQIPDVPSELPASRREVTLSSAEPFHPPTPRVSMTTSKTQGYAKRLLAAFTGLPCSLTHRLRVTGVAVAVGVAPSVTWAQAVGPVTFRDSLVMRQLVFRAPCPNPVPRSWSLIDSTLGRPPRCNLVEVAARAIAQFVQARPQAAPVDPWNPLCVRVTVRQNTGTTGLPADWWVLFDLTANTAAWVVIDRHNGDIGMTVVGPNPGSDWPRCLLR